MSQQKCMSCSKCSNSEDKDLKLCYQRDKVLTMICNRQNIDNGAFTQVFTLLKIKLKEKFNLKIKLTETKLEQSVL